MSRAKQRKYVLSVKRELLHVEGKPPRNYQAPLPSRTQALAPFWGAWNKAMKGHAFSVKGMSPQPKMYNLVFVLGRLLWSTFFTKIRRGKPFGC